MGLAAAIPAGISVGRGVGNWINSRKKKKTTTTQGPALDPRIVQFQQELERRRNERTPLAAAERGNLQQGFTDLANRPGYQSQNRGAFEEFSRTGGIDPTRIQGDADSLRKFGQQGGHKFFGELADTGGWDANRTADFRSRVASQTPSFYTSLRDDLNRRRRIQGGVGTGFAEADAKLARESARGSADAVREGELSMGADKIQNQLAGAQGFSSNFLQGLQASMGGELSLQNLIQSGRQFGISGMENADQYGDSSGFRNQSAGLQGLLSLFGSRDGELSGLDDDYMASIGMGHNIEQDYWNRDQMEKQKRSNLINQILGAGGGALEAWLKSRKDPNEFSYERG